MTLSTTDAGCYIGVDVGTGSVRAGVFAESGTLLGLATKEIQTWRSDTDHRIFEQSSDDIWDAVCFCVRAAVREANMDSSMVKGIGFDATCSLVVVDEQGGPICVSPDSSCGTLGKRNVILWADHRAEREADLINNTRSVVLDYIGGKMSLEMEIPKILWLKKQMTLQSFSRCQFFDLPDYLTYRTTGSKQRSSCSLVCKCTYIPHSGWQSEFFESIGLAELVHTHYRQLSDTEVLTAGMPVGSGLTPFSAKELGLFSGTAVGSAVIDAYAGWIGSIGARYYAPDTGKISAFPLLLSSGQRLAAVAGTSTCYLVQSPSNLFVPGVWGPYKDVIFPGWWMNEGGQSSTGQLIDFVITTHPAYSAFKELEKTSGLNVYDWLDRILKREAQERGVSTLTELVNDLHIYPDWHGNRSPIADSRMKGSMMGLTLDKSSLDLARKFRAALEGIALQTKHIIEELNRHGHNIGEIYISGGQAKNHTLVQLLADVCDMSVIVPQSHSIPVILGSAILGRCAAVLSASLSQSAETLWGVMTQMTPAGSVVQPSINPREKRLLNAKYRIYKETIDIQLKWRGEMEKAGALEESVSYST